MDNDRIVLSLVFLSVLAVIAWRWIYQTRKVRRTEEWPTTEATIETGALEAVATLDEVSLATLGFSYKVDAELVRWLIRLKLAMAAIPGCQPNS